MNYFKVPDALWEQIKKGLPPVSKRQGSGRPRADDRRVWNGIWYVLWTGCQWKAVHRKWFGVCSSVLHERFQTWQREGVFERVMQTMVCFYAHQRKIKWKWQSVDSKSCPAPLGGQETGKCPTDRGKIHLLVDQRGAPLALHITGANEHDKWSVDDLIVSIVVERPDSQQVKQHVCADKGYDFDDVHEFVEQERYIVHIKHRRRRNQPIVEQCPVPGEKRFPARRWVVERTIAWLAKRRSIRTRWCKKPQNWMAFAQFASAHILLNLAIYG